MPKDNHSVMQLYLDGFTNNFFTFFYVKEDKSEKINNKDILVSQNFLEIKIFLIFFMLKKRRKSFFK